MEEALRTPVGFLIFNRPEATRKVFEAIRRARPARLFVVADGPRPDRPGEAERCKAARAIIEMVDWPCEVETNFADRNLGCGLRVSSGLDWIFQKTEEAIILEDDCVPDQSFFPYCTELLERFRDDERVMVISGVNFQEKRGRTEYSYYYSRFAYMWGWASWRRAWAKYDFTMRLWPEIRDGKWLEDMFIKRGFASYWDQAFSKTFRKEIDTWDYQWIFACLVNSGLVVIPRVNLVSNIGFDADATHTNFVSIFGDRRTMSLDFPLCHPPYVMHDLQTDMNVAQKFFTNSYTLRIKNRLRWLQKMISN